MKFLFEKGIYTQFSLLSMKIFKSLKILFYCRFKKLPVDRFLSFPSISKPTYSDPIKKREKKRDFPSKLANFLPRPFLEGPSSANISANVSREPRRTESTSISKIEPFDSWGFPHYYAVRFRPETRFQISLPLLLFLLLPASLVLHSAPKAFSSAVFPTFPRGNRFISSADFSSPPPRCSFAVYAPSIGEFQFISWFLSHASISSEKDIRHFRGFEISITRCLDPAAPSEIVYPKENFILSNISFFFPIFVEIFQSIS